MEETPSILDTAQFRHLILDGFGSIGSSISNLQGFPIPEYDELNLTYYGTTNNISMVIYKKAGVVVGSLRLMYSIQPPSDNDAMLVKVIFN